MGFVFPYRAVDADALTASSIARASGRAGATGEANATPNRAPNPRLFLARFCPEILCVRERIGPALRIRVPARRRHAQVGERPRLAPSGPQRRFAGRVAHAPSLVATSVLGRSMGGTIAPPVLTAAPAPRSKGFKDLQRLGGGDAHMSGATRDDVRRDCEGPTAPWPCVPLLGPSSGVQTVMWTTMVEFQLSAAWREDIVLTPDR